MAGQQLLTLRARKQLGRLGSVAGQLGTLALDRLEETGVGDGDRRLVGKRLQQPDFGVGERLDKQAPDNQDTDRIPFVHGEHPEQS